MKKINADSVIKFFVSVIGLSVIFVVLKELSHIFVPFVIAYFLFFFFEPLNNFFEKKKIPLGFIILVDIVLTVSLLYGISRGVIDSVLQFSAELPDYEMKLNKIISMFFKSIGIKDYYYTHFKISNALRELDYSVIAGGVLSSTFSVFASIFLVLFFFIFISSGHDKIVDAIRMRFVQKEVSASIKKIKRSTSKSGDSADDAAMEEDIQNLTIQREVKLKKTFKDITEQVQKYVITKLFISISVGIVMGVMLWLFDVKFFIIWAVFAVILNFIPNIGSVIAVFFPVLMTLVQHESLGYALIVLAVLIFVQNVIGNIIEPKIFGNRLGLNPLVILISLLIWGYLWGIIGMFLSVPLTAILKIILSNSNSKNVRFISQLMSN